MQAKILTSTPDAVKVAFTAIRTCYSPHEQTYLWDTEFDNYAAKDEDHLRLIKQIVNHGHTSTLEHISYTFALTGVTRAFLAQLTRHRVGWSYSVQSQRYVKMDEGFGYLVPPHFTEEQEALLDETINDAHENYLMLRQAGLKPEDARNAAPQAVTTNMTVTCNLRAFLDFYSKRHPGTHAQAEIAAFAAIGRELIVERDPWTEAIFDIVLEKQENEEIGAKIRKFLDNQDEVLHYDLAEFVANLV